MECVFVIKYYLPDSKQKILFIPTILFLFLIFTFIFIYYLIVVQINEVLFR